MSGGAVIAEAADPIGAIQGGAPPSQVGQFIEDQKSQCGLIIPPIDKVVEAITGWSLLESLFRAFAGDFHTLSSMEQGWQQVARSLGSVAENYTSLGGQLPGVWTGPAGESAAARMVDVGRMHDRQQQACRHLSGQLGHVLEVSRAAVEVVAACVNFIDGVVQDLIVSGLAGPVGWLKEGVTAPLKARRIIQLIHDGISAIEKITNAARAAYRVLRLVNAGMQLADSVVDLGSLVASDRAAQHLDETARAGF